MDDDDPPPLEDMSPFVKPVVHQLQAQHNRRLYQQQSPGQENQARSISGEQAKGNTMFSGLQSGFFSKNKHKVKSNATPITTDKSALVIPEVQDAMRNDNQEWLTDDLLRNFVTNPMLLEGTKNPKIMQAMELMQKNPKEACDKFRNDSEVNSFIKSFATLMSSHYSGLATQGANSNRKV